MSHARKQIRDAAVSALSGITPRVVPHRVWIQQDTELPLVGVYTSDEASSLDEEGAAFTALNRITSLVMEIAVSDADGKTGMDALDAIAVEVETALGANRQLAGIMDSFPVSTEVEQSTEGDAVVSRMTLTYLAQYRTAIGDPENIV
jgi:hypothetical protein